MTSYYPGRRGDGGRYIRHRKPRSRQVRFAAALALSAALVAAFLASVGVPAGAEPRESRLDVALEKLQWCRDLRQFDTRTAADRAWADSCIRLAEREVTRLSTVVPTPTSTSMSPTPSNPPVTSTTLPPTTTPPPTTSPPAPAAGFPNAATTGTPAGWIPVTTRSSDLRVTTAGAVVEDVRLTGGADIIVAAPGVTIRRVELQGGRVDLMPGSTCFRTRIEATTFRRPSGTVTDADQEGAITPGGWNVDGSRFDGVIEGLRAGQSAACGANAISNSYIAIVAPDVCADWHGDGIQGYDGGPITVRNVTISFQERGGCGGTAPFFYPRNQGNTSVDIDRLLVRGGGYPFRNGMPGRAVNVKIVDGSWGYGPIDVRCSVLSEWSAQIVTVDSLWQPTTVRAQACNTETGT